LWYFRLTHVGDHQRPITVIRLLAEETTQSQIVIKRIFDIERLEPLGIETNELGSDSDGLGVYVWGHRLSVFFSSSTNAGRVNSSSGH
jgi:hypothetical protein